MYPTFHHPVPPRRESYTEQHPSSNREYESLLLAYGPPFGKMKPRSKKEPDQLVY